MKKTMKAALQRILAWMKQKLMKTQKVNTKKKGNAHDERPKTTDGGQETADDCRQQSYRAEAIRFNQQFFGAQQGSHGWYVRRVTYER